MKIFSVGALSTPRLHKLQITADEEGIWKEDLNTTVQKMFKEMVCIFLTLLLLSIYFVYFVPPFVSAVKKVIPFPANLFLVSYFSNLKSLVVEDKRSSLRYIFTSSVALALGPCATPGTENKKLCYFGSYNSHKRFHVSQSK